MCLEDEVEEIGLGWDVSFEWNGMERDEDRSIVCFYHSDKWRSLLLRKFLKLLLRKVSSFRGKLRKEILSCKYFQSKESRSLAHYGIWNFVNR